MWIVESASMFNLPMAVLRLRSPADSILSVFVGEAIFIFVGEKICFALGDIHILLKHMFLDILTPYFLGVVDKLCWQDKVGRLSKHVHFLPTFILEKCQPRGVGGQKRLKSCQRGMWTAPKYLCKYKYNLINNTKRIQKLSFSASYL